MPQILDAAGHACAGYVTPHLDPERSVDMHVGRIRRQLREAGIQNVKHPGDSQAWLAAERRKPKGILVNYPGLKAGA
ncbi:hypothetical protein [Allochromatium vinosum]|uniref:hypothetical protein n=1 Tax=Allochromatium vinosum TaxID=1049 RepID=UPI0001A7494B|nr:hypothetical protein [Allochromatium vinosum]